LLTSDAINSLNHKNDNYYNTLLDDIKLKQNRLKINYVYAFEYAMMEFVKVFLV